jgi:cell shape-determining protein MreD
LATILAFPVLVILIILQTTIVSRLPLLLGTADLVLLALAAWALQERVKNAWIWAMIGGLIVSFISAVPFLVPLISYVSVTAIARVLQKHVWQTPLLAMFVTTILGTMIDQGLTILSLKVLQTPIDIWQAINQVLLPSLLLNLVLALPIRALMVELAQWAYPVEIQT